MSSETIEHSAAERIAIAFDIEFYANELDTGNVLAAIRAALTLEIIRLLNSQPDKLMAILYRIDVSEEKVNAIFNEALPIDVPEELANSIIERQLEKAHTRALWRNS